MSVAIKGIGRTLPARAPSADLKQCRKGHQYRATQDTVDPTRNCAQCPICKEAREEKQKPQDVLRRRGFP
jgi:hypothetical protein